MGSKVTTRNQTVNCDSSTIASYIADLTAELAFLATKSHMAELAYFLKLAQVEAEIHAQYDATEQQKTN